MRNIDPAERQRQFEQDTIQKLYRLLFIIQNPTQAEGWKETSETIEQERAECPDNLQAIAAKHRDL